ncbi:MAG: fibro-slime domain-containing protein [Planctomycetota bacterium]|nr:MAG: fibro-slime domain-containing protein [Planctomycetota bacterium]
MSIRQDYTRSFKPKRRPRQRSRWTQPLSFESLEPRQVLAATFTWQGQPGTAADWNVAANWAGTAGQWPGDPARAGSGSDIAVVTGIAGSYSIGVPVPVKLDQIAFGSHSYSVDVGAFPLEAGTVDALANTSVVLFGQKRNSSGFYVTSSVKASTLNIGAGASLAFSAEGAGGFVADIDTINVGGDLNLFKQTFADPVSVKADTVNVGVNSNGDVEVRTGTELTTAKLEVATGKNGKVDVQSGGTLSVTDQTNVGVNGGSGVSGELVVSGAASIKNLSVGLAAKGNVEVKAGGTMTASDLVRIGTTEQGTFDVHGTATIPALNVGVGGKGELTINGTANLGTLLIGEGDEGTVTVESGGNLTATTQAIVGNLSEGALSVTGAATFAALNIGVGAKGTVTVDTSTSINTDVLGIDNTNATLKVQHLGVLPKPSSTTLIRDNFRLFSVTNDLVGEFSSIDFPQGDTWRTVYDVTDEVDGALNYADQPWIDNDKHEVIVFYHPSNLTLNGTLRDFSNQHVDMESATFIGLYPGIPQDKLQVVAGRRYPELTLDPAVRADLNAKGIVNSANSFDEWYGTAPAVGLIDHKAYSMQLNENQNGNYRFLDTDLYANGFYPHGPGDQFHTLDLHGEFVWTGKDEFILLTADDDAWVFINNKLVSELDLGGVHPPQIKGFALTAADAVADYGMQPNQTATIDIFYADRRATQARLEITTSILINVPVEGAIGVPLSTVSPSFDFEPDGGVQEVGYLSILDESYSSATGYGWTTGTITAGPVGQTAGGTDLLNDFVETSSGTFAVDLTNDTYLVTVAMGDEAAVRDQMQIDFENGQVTDTVDLAAGEYHQQSYVVEVTDGQLELNLSDLGGVTSTAVLNGLEVVPLSSIPNDAPVLADTVLHRHLAFDEVFSGNDGWLVDDLVGGITDDNFWNDLGIAIQGTNEGVGTLEYRLTDTGSWTPIGAVTTLQSLLLPADGEARIRLVSSDPWMGLLDDAITFVAWDQTSGSAGALVDTSTRGGTTAFSLATDTLDLTVTPFATPVTPVSAVDVEVAPAVGSAADGRFVTVYVDLDGSDYKVYAQRYDATGAAVGSAIEVGTSTGSGSSNNISVDMDDSGNFAVAWADTAGLIQVQRYASDGTTVGSTTAISGASASSFNPTIVYAPSGDLFVAWNAYVSFQVDVMGSIFDSGSSTWGSEFALHNNSTGDQIITGVGDSVAVDSAGNYIVTWHEIGSQLHIWARRFTSAGVPIMTEFQVSNDPSMNAVSPAVAVDGSGNYTITWKNVDSTFTNSDVVFRRYNSLDVPGAVQTVRSNVGLLMTHLATTTPTIAADSLGNFVIAWSGTLTGSSVLEEHNAYAQWYDSTGTATGSYYQVDDGEEGYVVHSPHVDVDGQGNYIFVWLQDDDDEESILTRIATI